MIGATVIESEETGPVSLRSALDLLSAAYALDPAFAEAEIVLQGAGARPAFPDNRPRIIVAERYIYVNGLYRHGFLLAPVMAELRGRLYRDRRDRSGGVRCRFSLMVSPSPPMRTLAELCATLGLCASESGDRGERQLRRFGQTRADAARAQGRGRDRCAEAGRLMLDIYGERFKSRLLLGTAQYPPRQRSAKRSKRRPPRSSPFR